MDENPYQSPEVISPKAGAEARRPKYSYRLARVGFVLLYGTAPCMAFCQLTFYRIRTSEGRTFDEIWQSIEHARIAVWFALAMAVAALTLVFVDILRANWRNRKSSD